ERMTVTTVQKRTDCEWTTVTTVQKRTDCESEKLQSQLPGPSFSRLDQLFQIGPHARVEQRMHSN
ncbi:hypothetical protein AVEN_145141-1, partial [Araneus ventricosus]